MLSNIGAVLGTPGPVLLALAFGTYTFQYLALSGLLPALLVDRMGLSIAAAGTVSAIAVAANAVGNMSAGALLRLGVPVWSIMAGAFAFVGLGRASASSPTRRRSRWSRCWRRRASASPASFRDRSMRRRRGIAPTSAMLAIALGLINQVTNIGNLAGPAAMAFTVQSLGWSGAPLLFAGVAVTGVTIALLLRSVLRRDASLRLNAGLFDAGPSTSPARI